MLAWGVMAVRADRAQRGDKFGLQLLGGHVAVSLHLVPLAVQFAELRCHVV